MFNAGVIPVSRSNFGGLGDFEHMNSVNEVALVDYTFGPDSAYTLYNRCWKGEPRHIRICNDIVEKHKKMTNIQNQRKIVLSNTCKIVKRYHKETARKEEARGKADLEKALKEARARGEKSHSDAISEAKQERLEFMIQKIDDITNCIGKLVKSHLKICKNDKKTSDSRIDGEIIRVLNPFIHEKINAQPQSLEMYRLKGYQLEGLQWLVSLHNNGLNGILSDDVGIGKIVQLIAFFLYLKEHKQAQGPHMIITSLSNLEIWHEKLVNLAPSLYLLRYVGTKEVRKRFRSKIKGRKRPVNIFLTTPDYIRLDKSYLGRISWKYIVVDKGCQSKNIRSSLNKLLWSYKTEYRLFLKCISHQNSLQDMWNLVNFILPDVFNTFKNFDEWFQEPLKALNCKFDIETAEKKEILERLNDALKPFFLRRLNSEVEAELPREDSYVIHVELSPLQRILYNAVIGEYRSRGTSKGDVGEYDAGNFITSKENTQTQLRKVCNHPFLFPDKCKTTEDESMVRVCAKLELVDRILAKMQAAQNRVLFFW